MSSSPNQNRIDPSVMEKAIQIIKKEFGEDMTDEKARHIYETMQKVNKAIRDAEKD